LTSKVSN